MRPSPRAAGPPLTSLPRPRPPASTQILWDAQTRSIVSNESADIVRILNSALNEFAANPSLDLYPPALRAEIDEVNAWVYDGINNGVYKCGFAKSQVRRGGGAAVRRCFLIGRSADRYVNIQRADRAVQLKPPTAHHPPPTQHPPNAQAAYDAASAALLAALERAEALLARQRYLVGNVLTEADVRLFMTLIRFDPVSAAPQLLSLDRTVGKGQYKSKTQQTNRPTNSPTIHSPLTSLLKPPRSTSPTSSATCAPSASSRRCAATRRTSSRRAGSGSR